MRPQNSKAITQHEIHMYTFTHEKHIHTHKNRYKEKSLLSLSAVSTTYEIL